MNPRLDEKGETEIFLREEERKKKRKKERRKEQGGKRVNRRSRSVKETNFGERNKIKVSSCQKIIRSEGLMIPPKVCNDRKTEGENFLPLSLFKNFSARKNGAR